MNADAPLYVLSGGASARFGSDKARALLAGQPLLLHVVRALQPETAEVTVVADRPDKYADLGLRTIADLRPRLGPLGGLQAALADLEQRSGQGWLLLSCCDLIGAQRSWVERLALAAPGAGAAAFFDARQDAGSAGPGRWEPLPALYHSRARPEVERALDAGELALWRLLARIARPVELPPGWDALARINTRADLDRLAPPATNGG